jgi:hypothetical protein
MKTEKLQHYGLEFLTVFLGVTLSLVAENFRQQRSDLNAEHNSMAQMYSDLRAEDADMQLNLGTARLGLQSARLLAAGARGHSPDSISAALTGLGQCSFFIPSTSEYTALKSSGRLAILEDPRLRESIIRFYEGDSFAEWLHERDCLLTGDLMDSLVGKLEFAEALPIPDSLRRQLRGGRGRGQADSTTPPADTARRAPRRAGRDTIPNLMSTLYRSSRYPRVVYRPTDEAVISDPQFRDRVMRLAVQRNYLITYLEGRIRDAQRLRDTLKVHLGSDTVAIRSGRNSGSRNRGSAVGPAGGTRR